MATTYNDYTGDGSNRYFNLNFEYLRDSHVKVKVNGVEVGFVINTDLPTKRVYLNTTPALNAKVKVYRDSRGDFSPLVDFEDGSVLTQVPLDEAYRHNLFTAQEASEGTGNQLLAKKDTNDYDAEGNKIINLGTPTASTDAANKAYTDQTVDAAIALGGSPAIVSLGGYDVTALGTSITKSLANWTNDLNSPTATGSTTARSLTDRFADVVNVLDFIPSNLHAGIINDTNITDLYPYFQAAVDKSNEYTDREQKKTIVIPPGTYRLESTFVTNVSVQGLNYPRLKSIGDIPAVKVIGQYISISDLLIQPDGTGSTSNDGLWIANAARSTFSNITITGCGNDGVVFDHAENGAYNNNLCSLNNIRSFSNGQHGIHVKAGIDNNGIVFNNLDVRGNTLDGFYVNTTFAGNFFNGLAAQNNTRNGVHFDHSDCRNNVGTSYVEANAGTDLLFSSAAHSNFITLTNDGSTRTDNNGTNTILSSASGSSQRFTFNTIDLLNARLNNNDLSGILNLAQTGTRTYSLTQSGTSSTGTLIVARGSSADLNLLVQGITLSEGAIFPQSSTTTSPGIYQNAGSPEGFVTARPGSLCLNSSGGAGVSLYVKESGTGNTGWVAK